jgi:site-specific DNA-methyltransferase (adenine-specific)
MLVQQNIVNEIITGNCKEILSRIPANSIQLTITSPPYRNAIDYNMHVSGNGGYYRGRTKLMIMYIE